MHILYLHQYFATPRGSTGTRSYEFARRWAAAGHKVTVLTSTAQLTPADLRDARTRGLVSRFHVDGIDVIALRVPYRQSMSFGRRIGAFLAFMLLAGGYAICTPCVDVVYASSTPITVGVPALLARWFRKRPFVFEVRDPWPELPIQMGVIRHPVGIRAVRRLERTVYGFARAVVALSPGMEQLVRAVAPPGRTVVTIPNAADTDRFQPDVERRAVRRLRGWEGRFVCIHCGAMGRVNGLDLIVRAADRFRDDPNFLFVLIGEGREKSVLREGQARLGLTNLLILDGVAKHELPAYLGAADLCLMTVAPLPILEHNSANKFFDYLSAGRPVLLNYSGWQRELLESARAGLGCRIGDDEEFFQKLSDLRADPARCLAMPRNARRLAVERFDRDKLARQALELIESSAVPTP
jgi:glycosyltransferase involved in cell wall biosynthesis